ncbi:MAG TPA: hypothetical protein VFQ50_05705 [Flavobacterium sp.]|jgi:uncharacterized membrane protein YqgA involved in biofilm formation|nr:hypothetical protein [Flavobacterium sp.]
MTQNTFGALFILGWTAVLIGIKHFDVLDYLTSFLLVPILASYYLGRYSTTLPKGKE